MMKSCPITITGQDITSLSQNPSEKYLSDQESTNIGYIRSISPVFKKSQKIAMKGILKGKVLHRGGPSSQPSTYEDVSIHTGEPKSTTRTSKWPEQHNMVLAELLMEQHLYGNMCNSILRKELWCDVVRTLNCRLRTNYTGPTVMMRFKNMKSDFRTLYQLSNQSGWGWDEKLHMPIASDEIWEEILMDRPKMARFRRNPFYQYKIFEKICGENIAIGTFARSSRSTQPTDEIEAEELDPGNDDFMSGNDISFINEEDFPETENGEVIKEVVEAELSNKPLSGSKRSSDISSRPSRKNKQKTKRGTIKNLLHLQNENIELFRQSIERHAPYSMTQCLTKLVSPNRLSLCYVNCLRHGDEGLDSVTLSLPSSPHKWRMVIAYDGSKFAGWQYQESPPTIQCVIEKALTRITKLDRKQLCLVGAGRTDAGVHAWGQVAHFITPFNYDCLEGLHAALNGLLPSEIRVREISSVCPDFHARFSTISKLYHYKIYNDLVMDPFQNRYAYHSGYKLNPVVMREAASYFVGRHDFTSFANASHNDGFVNPVKEIFRFHVKEMDNVLQIEVEGTGFLYRQVRNMVALLIVIGREALPPDAVLEILAACDRRELAKFAMSAPPHGLCLMSVNYSDDILKAPAGCPAVSFGRPQTVSKCKLPSF